MKQAIRLISGLMCTAAAITACHEGPTATQPSSEREIARTPPSGGSRTQGFAGPLPTVPSASERPLRSIEELVGVPRELLSTTEDHSLTPAGTDLPVNQGIVTSATAFRITQGGTGHASWFRVNNPENEKNAIVVTHVGGGSAIRAVQSGTGRGVWGQIVNSASNSTALQGTTTGGGIAVFGLTTGSGPAGLFQIVNPANPAMGLGASTNGTGHAGQFINTNPTDPGDCCELQAGLSGITVNGAALSGETTGPNGIAGLFTNTGTTNPRGTLEAVQNGQGPVFRSWMIGSGGDHAVFVTGSDVVARVDRTGKGFFNGGTQTGGADVAESIAFEGERAVYEPGDVLVISQRADRRVTRSRHPYSTRVIGVYATRPGVLLSEQPIGDPLEDQIPVGVVGIIPTKVTDENGPIRRSDLLVSSSWTGHAMRATENRIRHGSVIGKAMEEWSGDGTAIIRVMVNVR